MKPLPGAARHTFLFSSTSGSGACCSPPRAKTLPPSPLSPPTSGLTAAIPIPSPMSAPICHRHSSMASLPACPMPPSPLTNSTSSASSTPPWKKSADLKTARAYQIRLVFQELYNQPAAKAESYLKRWYFWATHSRLQPIIDVAKTIRRHQQDILRWFTSGINNGILEGINSLVQAAKAKARGYRSDRNLATVIYLIAGKLHLPSLPT